jgi:nucleoside-diphosphate kinase
LQVRALRSMTVERELAERHYAEHAERPFFAELVQFITSGPIVALVLEGEHAVKAARQVIGATDPLEAASGSIRGDFAVQVGQNLVHGSDSPESAARESALFFPELG